MVLRLNKLLSRDEQSNEFKKPFNRNCGIDNHLKIGLTQHLKILNNANVTYTLSRGSVASSSQYDIRLYNLTSFRKLGHHLEYSVSQLLQSFTNDDSNKSSTAYYSANIDRIIRTILRLLNYRTSSLWRPDQKSQTLRDSCVLYDDVDFITRLFDKLSRTLHHFMQNNRISQPAALSSMRSAKLSHTSQKFKVSYRDENTSCWIIVTQLLKLRLITLPGIIGRIENYSQHYIIQETYGISGVCLKRDSFLGTYKTAKKGKNIPTRSELTLIDLLLEMLDKKVFSPAALIMRSDNFLIVARILSKGFNTALRGILSYVLLKKLQFNHQGVIVLYAILQKFQNWILDIKGRLLVSEHCSVPENQFHVVQDKVPWTQANTILGILQTGQIYSVNSPSEEYFSPKSSAKIRGKKSVSLHFHNSIFPLRTYLKERNDEVSALEQLLPVRPKVRLRLRQDQPPNTNSTNCTSRFSTYAKSSSNSDPVRTWVILDSMRIFYHHTENQKKDEPAFTSNDFHVWSTLAAKAEITSILSFHPLSIFNCIKKSSPTRSSVSVCVAIDVNNF